MKKTKKDKKIEAINLIFAISVTILYVSNLIFIVTHLGVLGTEGIIYFALNSVAFWVACSCGAYFENRFIKKHKNNKRNRNDDKK